MPNETFNGVLGAGSVVPDTGTPVQQEAPALAQPIPSFTPDPSMGESKAAVLPDMSVNAQSTLAENVDFKRQSLAEVSRRKQIDLDPQAIHRLDKRDLETLTVEQYAGMAQTEEEYIERYTAHRNHRFTPIEQAQEQAEGRWVDPKERGTIWGEAKAAALNVAGSVSRIATTTITAPLTLVQESRMADGDTEGANRVTDLIDTINKPQEFLQNRLPNEQRTRTMSKLADTWDERTTDIKKNVEEDDYLGVLTNVLSIGSDAFSIMANDPATIVDSIVETLPDVAVAGRSMVAAIASTATTQQKAMLDEWVSTYGDIPEGDDRAKMNAYAVLAATMDLAGDRIVAQGGRLVGLGGGSTARARDIPKNIAFGSGGEFFASGGSAVASQMGVHGEVVDGGAAFAQGTIGAGSSGAQTAGIAGVQTAKDVGKKGAEKAVETRARRVVAQEVRDEGGDKVAEAVDAALDERSKFTPMDGMKAIYARQKSKDITPEESATNIAESHRLVTEYIETTNEMEQSLVKLKEIAEPSAKEKMQHDLLEKKIAVRDKQIDKFTTNHQAIMQTAVVAPADVATVKANREGTTEAADRIMGTMLNNPDSITEEMATDLLVGDGLTPNQRVIVEAHFEGIQIAKDMETVQTDILKGGDGFLGIENYRNSIGSALVLGNTAKADKQFDMLATFADRHAKKLAVMKEAVILPKAQQREALGEYAPSGGWVSDSLVDSVTFEVAALNNAVKLMEAQIQEQAPIEAKAEPTVEPTVQETTEPTAEPEVTEQSDVDSTTGDVDIADAPNFFEEDGSTPLPQGEATITSTDTTTAEQRTEYLDTVATEGFNLSQAMTTTPEVSDQTVDGKLDKDKVHSVNQVSQHFSAVDREGSTQNPLQVVANAMTELTEIAKFFMPKGSINNNQAQVLNGVTALHAEFQKSFKELVKKNDKEQTKDMMQYLLDAEGNIDDNIIGAMAVSAYNWMGTAARDNVIQDVESINSMFGQNADAFVDPKMYEVLSVIGVHSDVLNEDLGKNVVAAMGIRANKDAPGNYQGKLESAMGMMTVTLMMDSGYLTTERITGELLTEFNNIIADQNEKIRPEPTKNSMTFFRPAVDPGTIDLAEEIAQIAEDSSKSEAVLTDLFSVTSHETGPTSEPSKAKIGIVGSHLRQPKSVTRSVQKQNNVVWKVKEAQSGIAVALGDSLLHRILGIKDDVEENVHLTERAGTEGANGQIVRGVQKFMEFLENQESVTDGFHFAHNIWKNHRIGIDSNTINPQANKFHRHMIKPDYMNSTIDTNNKNQMDWFKVAVAQGLGISIDKLVNADTLGQLEDKLDTLVIQDGLDAIRKSLNNKELTDIEKEQIVLAVEAGKEKTHSLDALVAYAQMLEAGTGTFVSDLGIEVDGITNGPAIGTIQFGIGSDAKSVEDRFKPIGMYINSDTMSFQEWISQPTTQDNYEDITSAMLADVAGLDEGIRAPMEYFFGELQVTREDQDGNEIIAVSKPGRNLTKYPLMTTIYGSGKKAIARGLAESFVEEIYKSITKNRDNPTMLKEIAKQINLLAPGSISVNDLLNKPLDTLIQSGAVNKIKGDVEDSYGEFLNDAIEAKYGEFIEKRTKVNDAMKLVHEMFMLQYNHAIEKRTNEMIDQGLLLKGFQVIPKSEADKILADLIDAQPIVRTFFSKSDGGARNEGIFLSKTKKERPKDAIYQSRQVYSRATRGGTTKQKVATSSIDVYQDGGVAPAVMLVQHLDASTMHHFMNRGKGFGVHDAIIAGSNTVVENSVQMNKGFSDVMDNYSIAEEVALTLTQSMAAIKAYDVANGTTLMEAAAPHMGYYLDPEPSFMKKQDKLDNGEYDGFMDGAEDAVDPFIVNPFNNWSNEVTGRKQEITDMTTAVGQYGLDGGIYYKENHKPKKELVIPTEPVVLKTANTDYKSQLPPGYKTKAKLKEALNSVIGSWEIFGEQETQILKDMLTALGTKKTINEALEGATPDLLQAINEHAKRKKASQKRKNKVSNSSVLGSSVNASTVQPDLTSAIEQKIDAMNSQQVFDNLAHVSHKKEGESHTEHLKDVLTSLINKVIKPVTLRVVDTIGDTMGSIQGSDIFIQTQLTGNRERVGATVNGVKMSAQEVYVHELIHSVSKRGIETGSRNQKLLTRLHAHARKHIRVEDLMDDSTNDKDSNDYKRASETWEYIFNPTRSKVGTARTNYLHEFAAFGLTNERLVQAMQNIPTLKAERTVDAGNNVFEYLRNFVNYVMDLIGLRFVSHEGRPDAQLRKIVSEISGIEAEKKSVLYRGMDNAISGLGTVIGAPIAAATATLGKLADNEMLRIGGKTILGSVTGAAQNIIKLRDQSDFVELFIGELSRVKAWVRSEDSTQQGFLGSLMTEMMGRTIKTARFHDLSRAKRVAIDMARKDIEGKVRKTLLDHFQRKLTTNESTSITKAALKTDLSSLLDHGFTIEQITELLSNPQELTKRINALHKVLRQDKHGVWLTNQADSLGHFMSTGRASKHQLTNAHQIVNMFGSRLKPNASTLMLENQVDLMATLSALSHTSNTDKNAIAELLKEEANKEGMFLVLQMHRAQKKNDKSELFDGSEYNIIKGYTAELTNPDIDVKIETEAKGAELLRLGYVRGDRVIRDKHDTTEEKVYIYINPNGGLTDYAAGLISLTNPTSKGTDTLQMLHSLESTVSLKLQSNSLIQSLIDQKRPGISALGKGTYNPAKDTSANMVPLFNSRGVITGYRYMTTEAFKDDTLEKNNDFADTMAEAAAYSVDKVNSKKVNEQLIDAMREQFLEDMADGTDGYVTIGPTSTDPKLLEMYKMMPDSARRHMRKVWGKQSMQVRRDLVPILFGHRKLSAADIFKKENHERSVVKQSLVHFAEYALGDTAANKIRKAGNMWKEYVREVKDFVVIKSGTLTVFNALSNSTQLITEGVPMENIIRDQQEAYTEARRHREETQELFELQALLDAGIPKQGQRWSEDRIAHLEFSIQTNIVTPLISDGMMQSIIEDVALTEDRRTHKGKGIQKLLDKYGSKVPGMVQNGIKTAYMSHDTKMYKFMTEAAQLSDFTARYALYKHYTTRSENKMSHNDAIGNAMDVFINYDMPTHAVTQYGNDMGLLWYTKYFFRIQKTLLKNFKENPRKVLSLLFLNNMFGGSIPTVYDSSLSVDNMLNRAYLPPGPLEMLSNSLYVKAL